MTSEASAETTLGFAFAARLDDLEPGTLRGVVVDGARVCLARVGDEVFALADQCPHAAFPLSEGDLLADGRVQCAWHGARFDLRTGAACGLRTNVPATRYDVQLRNGDVYVKPRR